MSALKKKEERERAKAEREEQKRLKEQQKLEQRVSHKVNFQHGACDFFSPSEILITTNKVEFLQNGFLNFMVTSPLAVWMEKTIFHGFW